MSESESINDITYKIIGCVYEVYNNLGPGLLESVYEEALVHEFKLRGINFKQQATLPIVYKDTKLNNPLRIDIFVEDSVIVELKSVETLKAIHYKQVQTYLKLSGCKIGLLINFNTDNIKNDIHRIANKFEE